MKLSFNFPKGQIMNRKADIWSKLANASIGLLLLPVIVIVYQLLFGGGSDNWEHIRTYMLNKYMWNTALIVCFTGLFTALIGMSLAWLVSVFEFPLRGALKWGLMLPLAIPAYIGAYTYHGLLNYTGVLQTFLRNEMGLKLTQKYFNIMHLPGVVFIFTIFLYPYVYTVTRSFLSRHTASLIESARVLGHRPSKLFFSVIVPLARGAVVGGVSLVIMEVLNDYGVVKYYGVTSFSTAIFKAWFSMGDLNAAIRLAAILMCFVFVTLAGEKIIRGRRKYSMTTTKQRNVVLIKLEGWKKYAASAYAGLIFMLGFIIPVAQLLHWTYLSKERLLSKELIELVGNTLFVAIVATVIILIVAVIVANHNRLSDSKMTKLHSSAVSLGYSIPGAVISVGVIILFVGLDRFLSPVYKEWFHLNKTLVLSTSIVMLLFAYVLRFLAIGYNNVDSGLNKIGRKYHEASRMLGKNSVQTFFEVDLPMIHPTLIGAFVMVFIDMLKELPLTLILRPFNFDTLATKAFEYANDEMIHEAAIPSMLIIVISLILIFVLQKYQAKVRGKNRAYAD